MPLSIVRGEVKGVYILICTGDIGLNGEHEDFCRAISSYAIRGRKTRLLLVLTDATLKGEQALAALSYGCIRIKECGGVVKILNPPDSARVRQLCAGVEVFYDEKEAVASFE